MKRREFLRDSAIAAGTLASGLGFGEVDANPKRNSIAPETAKTADTLIEVPGASFEITDDLTKVPVTVTLGKFLMSPTQVTLKEYEEITGENPSFHRGANFPVETVSWWQAIRYCNLRSIKENLNPCYNLETGPCDMRKNGYRLPSDIEWTQASGGVSAPPARSSANLIHALEPGADQHELMAMIAPRPFLLIGGDKYDTKQSWYYINAARSVYRLYGKPQNIGYFNHHTGHRPTPDAIWRMNEWLAHFLGPQA